MADCIYADVSSFQRVVDDSYPYQFIAIRANDGNYRDPNFQANLAWCKSAVARGKLVGFIVYFVYETNWQETVNVFKACVGTPHPKMAVMIDVESWGGRMRGDQSGPLGAVTAALASWLGNKDRVIAYGNAGDLANLWPSRGGIRVALANYGANPSFPNKLIHQYADNYQVPPFGPCDINSADGLSAQEFAVALGLASPAPVPVPYPKPVPNPNPPKIGDSVYLILKQAGGPAAYLLCGEATAYALTNGDEITGLGNAGVTTLSADPDLFNRMLQGRKVLR